MREGERRIRREEEVNKREEGGGEGLPVQTAPKASPRANLTTGIAVNAFIFVGTDTILSGIFNPSSIPFELSPHIHTSPEPRTISPNKINFILFMMNQKGQDIKRLGKEDSKENKKPKKVEKKKKKKEKKNLLERQRIFHKLGCRK